MKKSPDNEAATFAEDGVVCLRQVIEPYWLDLLAEGTEKTLAKPTPYGRVQSKPQDPGYFFTDYYMWREVDEFTQFCKHGPGAEIAARLTQSATINFFFDGLFVKEPHTERSSDWHQDQPYYNVNGQQLCVMWTPLDPVSKDTSLRLVRGSHLSGRWYQPVFFASERLLEGAKDIFEPMPDIDADPQTHEVLSWDMEPGDCIVFHPLTIHGSRGNPTPGRRRAISTTWLGDDCVYAPRAGEVEPRIEGYDFSPGERLNVESVFPLVWPKPS